MFLNIKYQILFCFQMHKVWFKLSVYILSIKIIFDTKEDVHVTKLMFLIPYNLCNLMTSTFDISNFNYLTWHESKFEMSKVYNITLQWFRD